MDDPCTLFLVTLLVCFLSQRKVCYVDLERDAHMVGLVILDGTSSLMIESQVKGLELRIVDPTLYRSLAGSLQYLTFTRPDITHVVQQVCLYMHDPREPHFSALKRILRAEAEYRGVANAVAETCWIRNLLRELHTPLSFATIMYCDNVSDVYLSSNLVQHQRTKHIEIDIHFVRDLVATGQVRVLHVPSLFQYADIFTKGLPSALFEEFRTSLSVRCPPAPTAGELTAAVNYSAIDVNGNIGQTKVKRYRRGKAPEWADNHVGDHEDKNDNIPMSGSVVRIRQAEIVSNEEKENMEVEEDDEDAVYEQDEVSEYETDLDDEQMDSMAMMKLVFVKKSERDTIADREKMEAEERAIEEFLKMRVEERKVETKKMLVEEIRKDMEIQKNKETVGEIDTDDDENIFEAWIPREISRIKRDRENVRDIANVQNSTVEILELELCTKYVCIYMYGEDRIKASSRSNP
ncbi:ribonuclease H-like domain-containing protein [Tanacetum coccineum]